MKGTRAALIFLLGMQLLLGTAAAGAADENEKRIIKIGSDVTVAEGTKVRSVVTVGGQITVDGEVEQSVTALGGSVVLTRTAVVKGNVTALGGVIVAARDAQIDGNLTEINSSNLFNTLTTALSSEWEGWSWIFAFVSLAIFLVILVLALLIVALLPKPIQLVTEAITEHTFKVVLCGILALVLIAPLALLLTVSVVGIALIPLEVIIVVSSVLMGFIAVGQLIGKKVFHWLGRPNPAALRATFWGLILLWMIGWVPYIGWMVKALALVIGLGAALITRFGTHAGWKQVPAPGAAIVPPAVMSAQAVPVAEGQPVQPEPAAAAPAASPAATAPVAPEAAPAAPGEPAGESKP
ncbi:MAG: polymer-forming cytoskeletal protein [Deltaproteobacteria bacterium]|nr:polymer-forming cytoskeletal protein [Deltaproteobacteria bacterium]